MLVEPSIINNRYKRSISLGRGGNAEVFLAFDPITNRQVAIKCINCEVTNEKDLNYQKYLQEINTMASLLQKNIVQIYDTGIYEGIITNKKTKEQKLGKKPYVVMEYVKGQSLRSKINQEGFLIVDEVNDYMMQILDGLEVAHKNGIVHRDIKPENMLVRPDGTLVILDFGTAFHLDHQFNLYEDKDYITGTIQYMAPEYVEGTQINVLIDIYALGISLFEMFTGKLPFTHPNNDQKEIFKMHRHQPLPSITNINPNCPKEYEKIIIKACAKNPDERYQNVYELRKDLIEAYKHYKNPTDNKKESFFSKIFNKRKK